jgi:hypothetical protein
MHQSNLHPLGIQDENKYSFAYLEADLERLSFIKQ